MSQANQPAESATSSSWRSWITIAMAIGVLIPSALGFGTKFYEFFQLFRDDIDGAFAIGPILNYLLASAGFLLLLVWATMNGMFHDIEQPKYDMLDQEARIDKAWHVKPLK